MICRFNVQRAYELQIILNDIDELRSSCCNAGPKLFQARWDSWDDKQRRKFLNNVKDVCQFLRPLRSAELTVEATLPESQEDPEP